MKTIKENENKRNILEAKRTIALIIMGIIIIGVVCIGGCGAVTSTSTSTGNEVTEKQEENVKVGPRFSMYSMLPDPYEYFVNADIQKSQYNGNEVVYTISGPVTEDEFVGFYNEWIQMYPDSAEIIYERIDDGIGGNIEFTVSDGSKLYECFGHLYFEGEYNDEPGAYMRMVEAGKNE